MGTLAEVKKVPSKRNPSTAARLKALRDAYARPLEPARKLAAEAVKLDAAIAANLRELGYGR